MQINKIGGNVFFYDLDPKVKGQNQRSNISFCNKSCTASSILLKVAPYNNHIKLNKKQNLMTLTPRSEIKNQRSNISFCDKYRTSKSILIKTAPYNNHIKLNK